MSCDANGQTIADVKRSQPSNILQRVGNILFNISQNGYGVIARDRKTIAETSREFDDWLRHRAAPTDAANRELIIVGYVARSLSEGEVKTVCTDLECLKFFRLNGSTVITAAHATDDGVIPYCDSCTEPLVKE